MTGDGVIDLGEWLVFMICVDVAIDENIPFIC